MLIARRCLAIWIAARFAVDLCAALRMRQMTSHAKKLAIFSKVFFGALCAALRSVRVAYLRGVTFRCANVAELTALNGATIRRFLGGQTIAAE